MAKLHEMSDEELETLRSELQGTIAEARQAFIEAGKEQDRRRVLSRLPDRAELEAQLKQIEELEEQGNG